MLVNNLRKWGELSWAERGLLLETAVLSITVRLCLWLIPFRLLAPYLGRETQTVAAQAISQKKQQQADRISWSVQVVARQTRWQNCCLVNSIVAKTILRRRGIGTQLFLGLAKDDQRNLQAHAWLSCGDFIVTGQENHERFVIMTSFVE